MAGSIAAVMMLMKCIMHLLIYFFDEIMLARAFGPRPAGQPQVAKTTSQDLSNAALMLYIIAFFISG